MDAVSSALSQAPPPPGVRQNMDLVSVMHEFQYRAKDGRLVSIKPDESFILVSKTNEHWWHVRRAPQDRPFYVPALYVKELRPHSPAEDPPPPPDACRDTHRFSTFGLCDHLPEVKPSRTHTLNNTHASFASALYAQPGSEVRAEPSQGSQTWEDGEDMDFPLPPPLMELSECDGPPDPVTPAVEEEHPPPPAEQVGARTVSEPVGEEPQGGAVPPSTTLHPFHTLKQSQGAVVLLVCGHWGAVFPRF